MTLVCKPPVTGSSRYHPIRRQLLDRFDQRRHHFDFWLQCLLYLLLALAFWPITAGLPRLPMTRAASCTP